MQRSYEKSCKGKNRYTSRQFAKNIARAGNRQERLVHAKIRPYLCDWCGCWHVGHMRLKASK